MNDSKLVLANKIFNDCIARVDLSNRLFGKGPGDRYTWQYYLSRILYSPEYRFLIGEQFIKLIDDNVGHWDFQLAGREWSSIPLLIGLQDTLMYHKEITINSFLIKRERKNYGLHNFIEGQPNGLPILLVDDLCNSTNSFVHCATIVDKHLNLELLPYIFSVVNKTTQPYDKYLGDKFKALYILDHEEINAIGSGIRKA